MRNGDIAFLYSIKASCKKECSINRFIKICSLLNDTYIKHAKIKGASTKQ